ncbi:hypothetical protein [Escherichia coli]|uniref:hypothetical protein n=1 Tax=Escherichia coli TaxID=562 RepID=UPI002B2E35F6|nr:hypothetical protein VEE21_44310 [Escherichia coli]
MIVQKELVAIYDYEVPVPEDPFSFRLEIHKCSELFTGSVYRLERFRLRPTFHQRDREDADPLINDALIYIRDECIDERKLRGESPETVGSDSNLLIVFYVQIMPDDLVMQLHRF